MTKLLPILLLTLAVLLGSAGCQTTGEKYVGDFQKGYETWKSGHLATALREWVVGVALLKLENV